MAIKRFNKIILSKTENKISAATRDLQRPSRDAASTRVLMIEDNAEFAAIVGELLGELEVEFQIESAAKLGDGLSSLAGSDVDVVLLDLSLPDSNGLETL